MLFNLLWERKVLLLCVYNGRKKVHQSIAAVYEESSDNTKILAHHLPVHFEGHEMKILSRRFVRQHLCIQLTRPSEWIWDTDFRHQHGNSSSVIWVYWCSYMEINKSHIMWWSSENLLKYRGCSSPEGQQSHKIKLQVNHQSS